MSFSLLVLMIVHAGQQRRHMQQTGFWTQRRGWDDLREQHWNMYITVYKIDSQWELDVWHRVPKVGALWTTWRDRVQREEGGGSGCGGHMYTCGRFVLMYGKKKLQYCKVIILQFKQILRCFRSVLLPPAVLLWTATPTPLCWCVFS